MPSHGTSEYLRANSPGLYPGWKSGYDQVNNDINAMALDCHLPAAPVGLPQGGFGPAPTAR
jgi:hypothetical protein